MTTGVCVQVCLDFPLYGNFLKAEIIFVSSFLVKSQCLTKLSSGKKYILQGTVQILFLLIWGIKGLCNTARNLPSRLFSKFMWMTLKFKFFCHLLEWRLRLKRCISFFPLFPMAPKVSFFSPLSFPLPVIYLINVFLVSSAGPLPLISQFFIFLKLHFPHGTHAKYNCPIPFGKGLYLFHRLFL